MGFESVFCAISNLDAQECLHQVWSYFHMHPTAWVHCTATSGGDIRVRLKGTEEGTPGVAFTMRWIPAKELFFCRFNCPLQYMPDIPQRFSNLKETQPGEPQNCEGYYRPGAQNGVLLNAIDVSVIYLLQT